MDREDIYTTYAPDTDMTFIIHDKYVGEEVVSTEVTGWHYGEPYKDSIKDFDGNLVARYEV